MELFLWLVLWFTLHGVSVTLVLHRCLTHKSLKLNKVLLYLGVFFGYTAMQGNPLGWIAVHRKHHAYVDQEGDPHSPRHGFYHAFVGWQSKKQFADGEMKKWIPDLMDDKFMAFWGNNNFPDKPWLNLLTCILWRVLIFYIFGWPACLASIIAWITIYISPQLINTVCHMSAFGYKNFRSKNDAVNCLWLMFFSFGESLHNNHHFAPRRASQSFKWFEIDLTFMLICLLKKVGLAREVVYTKTKKRNKKIT